MEHHNRYSRSYCSLRNELLRFLYKYELCSLLHNPVVDAPRKVQSDSNCRNINGCLDGSFSRSRGWPLRCDYPGGEATTLRFATLLGSTTVVHEFNEIPTTPMGDPLRQQCLQVCVVVCTGNYCPSRSMRPFTNVRTRAWSRRRHLKLSTGDTCTSRATQTNRDPNRDKK